MAALSSVADTFVRVCLCVCACVCVCLCMCPGEEDGRELSKMEERIWLPSSNLTEKQIDQFLVVAR